MSRFEADGAGLDPARLRAAPPPGAAPARLRAGDRELDLAPAPS